VIGVDVNRMFRALKADDPVRAHAPLVIVHAARDPRAPDLRDTVHRGGGRRHAARVVVRQGHAVEPVGIFLGDEGRGDLARNEARMVHHRAERNGRLWPIPSTSKLSSATRIASSASARSAPQVQSFAIIGS
jgi:hypothetical protein